MAGVKWTFKAGGAMVVFGLAHYFTSRNRKNRKAVRLGLAVFALGILIILTGAALFQFEGLPQLPTGTPTRLVVYWLHILIPVICIAAYIGHRKAGPPIKWHYGKAWGAIVGVTMLGMVWFHNYDPRDDGRKESKDGLQYFEPSNARNYVFTIRFGKAIPNNGIAEKRNLECMMLDKGGGVHPRDENGSVILHIKRQHRLYAPTRR